MSFTVVGLPPVKAVTESRASVRIGETGDAVSSALGQAAPSRPFSEFLSAQIEGVNGLQKQADQAVADMVTGQSNNIHEMMIALGKADTSIRLLGQVRNKALDAYREVMRMSI